MDLELLGVGTEDVKGVGGLFEEVEGEIAVVLMVVGDVVIDNVAILDGIATVVNRLFFCQILLK